MRRKLRMMLYAGLCAAWAGCSTTSNLPEDETLYKGIKQITYDMPQPPADSLSAEQTGVITALADAYTTVENLLTGNAQPHSADKQDQKRLADSLLQHRRQEQLALSTTQAEVEAVLAYEPNGSLMGSSTTRWPIHPRLAIYNRYVNSTSRFGKWMFNTFATTPRFISSANPEVRTQIARNTLHNYGYFQGQVTYQIVDDKQPRTARIAYNIQPGQLFRLDSIAYLGFRGTTDSLIHANSRKSLLHRGEPFSVANLDGERNRLSELFRNQGYYLYQPDYITYRADTLAAPGRVQLQVVPSASMPQRADSQFYMGRTRIMLVNGDKFAFTDSITRDNVTLLYANEGGKSPVRLSALARNLFYRQGDLYRLRAQDFAQRRMQSMGIFSQLRMNYQMRDTTATCDTLDVNILAVLDKPYDAEFSGNVTTKSNGQVGPGVRFSMSKANAFRAAETIALDAWGSYEWQTGADIHGDRSLINSYEYGTSLSLTYPRFMLLGIGHHLDRRSLASTTYSVDARWMNRAGYFGRVSFSTHITYSYQPRRNIKHDITPFRLDFDRQLHTTARFDSIINVNQALYASMRDQFVPCLEYNYLWTSLRHAPRTLSINAKEAGNLTSGIYALAGESWARRGKELFNVPFAQYLKLSAQYTHKFRFTPKACLATRIYGGAIWSYGNATIAPYNDLFSIGGANSIRAFATRSIGPGSYHPAHSNYSYIDQMGDLKLEANAEYRFPIVANLHGALFLDAGNVWLIHPDENRPGGNIALRRLGREIALGTGAGLRYDLDFLIIRFDLGVGLHAPYDTGKSGYYNMPSVGKSLGYHLAIGYPF